MIFQVIRNWFYPALGALVLPVLTGCATFGINTKLPPNEGGVVVVSLGGAPLSDAGLVTLYVQDVSSKATGEFRDVGWSAPPVDFSSTDGNGYVKALRMPSGSYAITNFSVVQGNVRFSARASFSIPFTVEKGKITYLGEYLAYMDKKPIHSLSSRFFFSRMVVQDRQARDIEVMTKRMPEIAAYPVINAVLKTNSPSPTLLTKPPYTVTAEEVEKFKKAVADQTKETMDAINKPKCPTPVC
jgi:hypothetical protein